MILFRTTRQHDSVRAHTPPNPIGDPAPTPVGDPPSPISPEPQPQPEPGPSPEIPPPPATPNQR